jgi:hypothetical protein
MTLLIYLLILVLIIFAFIGIGMNTKQHFQNPNKYKYIGCFNDKTSDLALSQYKGEVSTINECADIAASNNSEFFGIQNVSKEGDKPMCFISSSDDEYDKHGVSDQCLNSNNQVFGKKNTNAVYQILSKTELERQEALKRKLSRNAAIIARGGTVSDSCSFNPEKIQGGFGTKLACKDYCMNPDNNTAFGGELCFEEKCAELCENCTNNQLCRWLTEPVLTEEQKVPKKLELEYIIKGSEVHLLWEKPETIDPISHYSIVITQMNNPDKLEITTETDTTSDFVEHVVRGLKPSEIYFIEVYSRNKFGYSEPSNSIEVQVFYTNYSGFIGETDPEQDESKMAEFVKELMEILKNQQKNSRDRRRMKRNINKVDISSPIDILTADKERDSKLQSKYNLDIFFNGM